MLTQLPQLPQDKANHYLYGTIAAAIARPIGAWYGLPVAGLDRLGG